MMPATRPDPCFDVLLAHDRAHIRAPADGETFAAFRRRLDLPLCNIVGDPVDEVENLTAGADVPVRFYRAKPANRPGPLVVYFHGGGFVAGSLDTHDAICRALCRQTKINLLSVAYRLAPEHPAPMAIEDGVSVLNWVASQTSAFDLRRVALCGDSAGGYLAMRIALAARDGRVALHPAHVGLLYPVVDPACVTPSMEALADGFVLTRAAMQWFWEAFAGNGEVCREDLSLLQMDMAALPPVSIITAGFDPLRDEAALLARRIVEAGGRVTLRCYDGMIHGFAQLPHLTPAADDALRNLSADVELALAISGGTLTATAAL